MAITKKMVDIRDFGAKGDGSNATAAFRKAATFLSGNASQYDGLIIPKGEYEVNPNQNEYMFTLSGLNGFTIDAAGANIVRNVGFASNTTAFLFTFDNCKNITAYGPMTNTRDAYKLDLANPDTMTSRGYSTFYFRDNNEGIYLYNQYMSDNYRLVLFGDGTTDYHNKNIVVQGIVKRSEYGANFANSGDDAIVQLYSELVHRTYFVYGARNHVANVETVNPTTTSCVIKAYELDTENIKANVFIQYSDNPEHRSRLGGGIDLYTQAKSGNATVGHLKNIELSVTARDSSAADHNHRTIIGIGAFSETGTLAAKPGIVDNLTIDLDSYGWRGTSQYRSSIAFLGILGSLPNGDPTWTPAANGTYVEPEINNLKFRNISIHNPTNTKAMEFSFNKLLGDCIVENYDSNMSLNIRNHGTTGRVIFKNVNINKSRGMTGGARAALNTEFIKYSNNHFIENIQVLENWGTGIPRIGKPTYQTAMYKSGSVDQVSNLTTVDILLYSVKPINLFYYWMEGTTASFSFTGILQVRWDATNNVFLSTTKVVRWDARHNNTPQTPSAAITPSIVLEADNLGLILRLTGDGTVVAGDLNYAVLTLNPYRMSST